MITLVTHTQANIYNTSPQRSVIIVCACRLIVEEKITKQLTRLTGFVSR
jgi:hypothetical protein